MSKTIIVLAALLSLCPGIGCGDKVAAQQPAKTYRVAYLATTSSNSAASKAAFAVLKKALQDLGYEEGRNLTLDARWSEGSVERAQSLAAELVALKPDIIIAATTPGTAAARQATSTIPIVMVLVSDPVGAGFVSSLAHPGANITGITDYGIDLAAKYVELARTLAPRGTTIGVLLSDNPVHQFQLKLIRDAAATMALTVVPLMGRSPEELETAFALAKKENAAALIVLGGPPHNSLREKIADLAVKSRLPSIFPARPYVDVGGLLSYGPNNLSQFGLAATFVDKILKGAKPADYPVQQPVEFELVINLNTAKAISVTIPQSLRLRADYLIQ
jgi:putative ABC transport system substrate-binding protein